MEQTQMHVYPNALAVHENGEIIFTDSRCRNIGAVNMAGIRTATFASFVSGHVGKLENPCAVAVVPDNLPNAGCFVIADNDKIVVLEPNHVLKMVFGSGVLKRPRGVVVVPAGFRGAGNIVVLDAGTQQIVEFNSSGSVEREWKSANFLPEAVAMIPYGVPGAGNMVLVEAKLALSRSQLCVSFFILDRNYKCLRTFGCRVLLPDRDIRSPVPVQTYVAVDDVGRIVFTDTRSDRICIFDRELEIECYVGLSEDFVPGGVVVVPHGLPDAGSVVVADRHGSRILVFDTEGVPRVLYPPLRQQSSLKDWAEKVDAWVCPVCLQETAAREVVACCVKDIQEKNPQAMAHDKGQHIHAVCRACYCRLRKLKAVPSKSVICPQCRSNALACVTLDKLVYNVDSTLSGRMDAGANPYIVHMLARSGPR
jgi:DNA-binding beta-propeller fold protein YncE